MAKTIGSFDLASLKNLRDDVTQYFWFESDSSSAWGSGAHVTLYPESQFTDSTSPNYMKGQNIIMNTDGFSIRNGGLPIMVLDNDSLDFNAVDTSLGTYTKMATFGLIGMQIYSRDSNNNLVQLANIGYDIGTSQSGTDIAPYYTFGVRKTTTTAYSSSSTYNVGDMCVYDDKTYVCVSDITTPESWSVYHWEYYIGNYSISEGFGTTASGYISHAEGGDTTANGYASHAEGSGATASGSASHAEGSATASGSTSHAEGSATASGSTSHAEGFGTTASGAVSHAEGDVTTASGSASHAQNTQTIASKNSQTAIGTFNTEDTSTTTTHPSGVASYGQYSFIIGNGTSSARSNALTVDWNGHIVATSAKKTITYTGEYIRLYGSEDAGTTAGRITITTSSNYVNCLPADKYSIEKSPLADDLFSESAGVVTIKKAGRYRIEGQVYLYNDFTVNDQITCCILLNNGTNAYRATRTRLYTTNPFTCVPISTVLSVSANATLSLGATNQQGARGTVGLSGYTRMTIECLGVYE